MNKAELIGHVATTGQLSKADAAAVVDACFNAITGALARGETVKLPGFGTFEVRERAARQGRNPKTGETINIPAGKSPGFKSGKGLKDAIK